MSLYEKRGRHSLSLCTFYRDRSLRVFTMSGLKNVPRSVYSCKDGILVETIDFDPWGVVCGPCVLFRITNEILLRLSDHVGLSDGPRMCFSSNCSLTIVRSLYQESQTDPSNGTEVLRGSLIVLDSFCLDDTIELSMSTL